MEERCNSDNDYELLYMIYQMDELSLQIFVKKYKVMCEAMIHSYLANIDEQQYEELILECMEQLYRSIYSFRLDHNTNFSTFFKQVIKFHLTNYYRKRRTFQGTCMRRQVSLDTTVREYNCTLLDMIPNHDRSLEGIYVLYIEGVKQTLKRIYKHLMPWEQDVIELRLRGYRYQEIAEKLNIEVRQVEYVLTKLKKWKSFH